MEYNLLYKLVAEIPPGQVATYGQLAKIVGCGPRQVGQALGALNGESVKTVPWHRVVNSQGKISERSQGGGDTLQGDLLRKEGVIWRASGRIDLKTYGWGGPFDPDVWR